MAIAQAPPPKLGTPSAAAAAEYLPPPLLTLESLPGYLLSRQLVDAADVVAGGFEVRDYSRRNRNFKVLAPSGKSLLVKQAGNPADADFREKLETEATLLEAVAIEPDLRPARWFSPTLLHFDRENLVLVTELIHPATSITKYHLNLGNPRFPEDSAVTCAALLASFHRLGARALREGILDAAAPREPFVWELFRHVERPDGEVAPGIARLAALLKERGRYWDRIPELRAAWKAHDGLIHMDVRWDNFLLTHGAGRGGKLNLRLIDWELAGRGDPAWDVACFLAENLRFWLMLHPVRGERLEPDFAARGRFPLEAGHAYARLFWRAYAKRARLPAAGAADMLKRIGDYLPFNLLLLAAEMVQRSDALHAPAQAAFMLSLDAAEDPRAALRSWYGLDAAAGVEA